MELIVKVNSFLNGIVMGWPGMILLVGTGVYYTIRCGGVQFKWFGYIMKTTIGKIFDKKEAGEGSVTPFQAVCTALAATVGTGNIAGVTGAIALGGPGAVFWMWVSALFGMCTKFAEVTLAIHFRERNDKGDWVGGPMYYIKNGLGKNWVWLGTLFSLFGMLAAFGIGNMTQINSIVTSISGTINSYTPINVNAANLIIGIIVAAFCALVLLGGLKRIGQVTEKLVPFHGGDLHSLRTDNLLCTHRQHRQRAPRHLRGRLHSLRSCRRRCRRNHLRRYQARRRTRRVLQRGRSWLRSCRPCRSCG